MLAWLRHWLNRPSHRNIVKDQVDSGVPPAVRSAYDRLRAQGWSERRIWRALVTTHRAAVAAMLASRRPFDREAYTRALVALGCDERQGET